jgi:hypothetical protein
VKCASPGHSPWPGFSIPARNRCEFRIGVRSARTATMTLDKDAWGIAFDRCGAFATERADFQNVWLHGLVIRSPVSLKHCTNISPITISHSTDRRVMKAGAGITTSAVDPTLLASTSGRFSRRILCHKHLCQPQYSPTHA